jgi:two-component system sensor histidine kinase/response regulator
MVSQKLSITLVALNLAGVAYAAQNNDTSTLWMWIAFLALATIGLTILYVFAKQAQKIQKLHKTILEKQLAMEKSQNVLLTNLSENIYDIAKQAMKDTHQVLQSYPELEKKEKLLSNVENRLLDVTNDLLDFLRLKSNKVKITHEEFNLNNVLNELSGSLASKFPGSQKELIFDIDKTIPRRVIGDSLHLGQILSSILEYQLDQENVGEVRLDLSMYDTYDDENIEIQFQITDTGIGLTTEELDKLFIPTYDEMTGSYSGLGLFVAHELIGMMDGKLSVQSTVGKGTVFNLTLPFNLVDVKNKRKYRLPRKSLIEKKVFIVDNNYNSALAIKKMFAYFRHEVTIVSQEEFKKCVPNLMSYDIVVLHETLFNIRLVEYLNKIKTGKEMHVIAINSLFKSDKECFTDDVIDKYLFKPMNQERVFEMIVSMYDDTSMSYGGKVEESAKVYENPIYETRGVTRESFKDFAGKNILIVEDNVINQKVLTNLLQLAGMNISIANNGQEAVDLVKGEKSIFDIVLMDINMPIMDGYTATQMIRLDTKFDSLPIVAFTALVLESEVKKMFNCGINAFLSKPLNIGKLYTALAMYCTDELSMAKEQEKIETLQTEKEAKEIVSYAGLDIEKGIKHASNSEALYQEVLKEFTTAYGTSDELFVKLVEEHRFEQIKMLCIDMRGLSATIGAYDMHELMIDILQQLLYKKYEFLKNYKEKYIFELKVLNRSIGKYIDAA